MGENHAFRCLVGSEEWSLEIGAEVWTRENMEDSEKSEFIQVEFVPSTLWSPPNSPFPPPTALHFYINSYEPIQRYIPHRGDKHRGHTSHRHILSHTCTQPREGYTEEHTPRSHSGTHTQLHRSQRSIHMYSHTYTCPWVTGIQTHTCTTRHTHTHTSKPTEATSAQFSKAGEACFLV